MIGMSRHLEYARELASGQRPHPGFFQTIGARVISAEPGRAVVELEIGPQHHNPMGTVHGGMLCDVADAAMGIAYRTTVPDEDGFTTIELKINFLRPVISGRVRAVGHLVKGGRRLGLLECDVLDDQDRLVARASSTCMTLAGEGSTRG